MAVIERVSVPMETLSPAEQTNAYLVGETDALLVDPAARTDDLDDAVARRSVAHVALTHTHPDHVGAAAHYAREHDATVWARAGRTERFERATGVAPDATLREGTTIETGCGQTVSVLETPGHAPDHLAFGIRTPHLELLVGDLAVASGSVLVSADEGDMRAYLTSLRRLYARAPARLYPGHGPSIDDPRSTLERLIRHRLAREARVRAAVESGARTLDEIVDAAYEKDISGVREYAASTAAAHLEKLAIEEAVRWDGERALPTP